MTCAISGKDLKSKVLFHLYSDWNTDLRAGQAVILYHDMNITYWARVEYKIKVLVPAECHIP